MVEIKLSAKERLEAMETRRKNIELRESFYRHAIKIENIENLNASQFENSQIRVKGVPFKIKKEERLVEVLYECTNCGTEIKSPSFLKKSDKCYRCSRSNLLQNKIIYSSGFLVTLINNISDISSSEHIKAFITYESLGIDINNQNENLAIKEFLKNTGNTIEIFGRLKSRFVQDSKTKKVTLYNEVIADEVYTVDDLEKFELNEETYNELSNFLKNRSWDDKTFDDVIVPEITGRILSKKFLFLTTLTVKELIKKGNVISQYGSGRGAIFGDYGESKSRLCKLFINYYCKGINALQINNETMTKAGLVAGVVKDGDDWIIDWGILPWANNGLLIMDGFHMFDKQTIASLRETETNNTIELFKIVKGKRECAYRSIKISNCRFEPIRDYYSNKYQASFDIGFGENDEEGKFNTADRRRVDWIIVYSKEDVSNSSVDNALASNYLNLKKKVDFTSVLSNLIKFAWTRKADHIDFSEFDKISELIKLLLQEWEEKYRGIKLSILEKDRFNVFFKYVIASAILHFRVSKEGVITPTIQDVDFVKKLYEEMFTELEVHLELRDGKVKNEVAEKISNALTDKQKELLLGLAQCDNITKLAENREISRTTFYNQFKDPIILYFANTSLAYKPLEPYFGAYFKIEPIMENGRLTKFGKQIVQFIQFVHQKTPIYNNNNNKKYLKSYLYMYNMYNMYNGGQKEPENEEEMPVLKLNSKNQVSNFVTGEEEECIFCGLKLHYNELVNGTCEICLKKK